VFGSNLYSPVQSAGTKWALAIADALVALVGLGVALPLWIRRSERPALEPPALRQALYLDDVYDATLGRPSEAFAHFAAVVVDNRVIDGAVNGAGRLVRAAGGALRRVQTGFVRQYALGIMLGAVVLLAWMASRALS
jgi:NADH-quinone oxidoreductase subunit L